MAARGLSSGKDYPYVERLLDPFRVFVALEFHYWKPVSVGKQCLDLVLVVHRLRGLSYFYFHRALQRGRELRLVLSPDSLECAFFHYLDFLP